MKPQPAADRRREISAIHAAATQLGLDTADRNPGSEYRQLLLTIGGRHSSSDMDAAGRQAVIRELQTRLAREAKRPKDGWHAEHMRKLWRQLGEAGKLHDATEAGLLKFVKSQTGRDHFRFLTSREGNRVVEALKAWVARGVAA